MEAGNLKATQDLLQCIPTMRHNTGEVKAKLANLDGSLPGRRLGGFW